MAIKSHFPAGTQVSTPYGRATVRKRRSNVIYEVELSEWQLSSGEMAMAFLNVTQMRRVHEHIVPGDVVAVHGFRGVTRNVRWNSVVVDVTHDNNRGSSHRRFATLHCDPSNVAVVGKTAWVHPFGRGRVRCFRKEDNMYEVAVRENIVCYVPDVRGLRNPKELLVGKHIHTKLGVGRLERIARDGMCTVRLFWGQTGGVVYMPLRDVEDVVGEKVVTWLGHGTVEAVRPDGVYEVSVLVGQRATPMRLYQRHLKLAKVDHPFVGQLVVTDLGIGEVTEARHDGMLGVRLCWDRRRRVDQPTMWALPKGGVRPLLGAQVDTVLGVGTCTTSTLEGRVVVQVGGGGIHKHMGALVYAAPTRVSRCRKPCTGPALRGQGNMLSPSFALQRICRTRASRNDQMRSVGVLLGCLNKGTVQWDRFGRQRSYPGVGKGGCSHTDAAAEFDGWLLV